MKKFFTLVAAALICASVSAKKVLESTWSPWGTTCTVDGNKLSFTASWAGAGYQLAGETAPLDLSDYDYIVVKMAKCTATTNFAVEYTTDGTPQLTDENKVATEASATANAQIVGIPLHLDYSTNVVQMWMQSTTPSLEVEVVEVYAATEDEYQADLGSNKQEMSPLSLADLGSGWGASYDAATKTITYESDWSGKGWWFNDVDYSDFDKFVVEFAEALTGYVQVVIEYNNDIASTTVGASAGETKIVADLDAAGKKSVKQIYLQNGEGVRTVVLANAYVATNKYVENGQGGVTPDPTESTALWEGNCVFGNWAAGFSIAADKFANVNAGDVMEFVYTTDTEGDGTTTPEWWQIKTIFSDTETTLESNAADLNDWGCATVSKGSTSYKITLIASDVAQLKEKGLFANGYFLVVTQVNLIQPTGINAVETAKPVENGVMYNLAGQKVDNSYKGVVIKNGKKFFQK